MRDECIQGKTQHRFPYIGHCAEVSLDRTQCCLQYQHYQYDYFLRTEHDAENFTGYLAVMFDRYCVDAIQWLCFSRNVFEVSPNIIYFYYLTFFSLGSSIQNYFIYFGKQYPQPFQVLCLGMMPVCIVLKKCVKHSLRTLIPELCLRIDVAQHVYIVFWCFDRYISKKITVSVTLATLHLSSSYWRQRRYIAENKTENVTLATLILSSYYCRKN